MENYDINFSCAFTGHRNMSHLLDYSLLESSVQFMLDLGVKVFYCGMARGFDLIAGAYILEVKKSRPDVKLIACVPCIGQEKYFSAEEKSEYSRILQACDEVKTLSAYYYQGCMQFRDRYMVDNSKYLLAFMRTPEGGTFYTMTYAKLQQREVYVI